MYEKEIGERIKNERERLGLTQTELGYELGQMHDSSAQGRVTKLEKGSARLKTEELLILAKLFNVSSDYLLGLTNQREKKTELTISDVFQYLFELEKVGLTLSLVQQENIVPHFATGEPSIETFEDVTISFKLISIINKLKEWKGIKDICDSNENEVLMNLYRTWKEGVLSDKEIVWSDINNIDTEIPF